MDDQDLLKKIVARNPLRNTGMERSQMNSTRSPGRRFGRHCRRGLGCACQRGGSGTEPAGLGRLCRPASGRLWKKETGGTLKPEIHISDPQSVNRLRAGETKNWDFLNVNNPWAQQLSLAGEADRRAAARPVRAALRADEAEVQAALSAGHEPRTASICSASCSASRPSTSWSTPTRSRSTRPRTKAGTCSTIPTSTALRHPRL